MASTQNNGSDDQDPAGFIKYCPPRLTASEMEARANEFYDELDQRRSVRAFSTDEVPRDLIATAIMTASSAPSGAHRQPWRFVAISNPEVKRKIRVAVEEEERRTYADRMSDEWRDALEPLGTDWEKPYLELAPWLVVVFEELYRMGEQNQVEKNYYVKESVGIATGFLIAAFHHMGLCTLTHTPSPMGFLSDLLARPKNERAFVLMPVGFPADESRVPVLVRKPLAEVATWHE